MDSAEIYAIVDIQLRFVVHVGRYIASWAIIGQKGRSMSERIEGRYDTLVVGAGGIGLSTSYHLAKLGQSVLLIDKGPLASGTSARAAGMLALLQANKERALVTQRSVRKIKNFEDESGVAIPYFQGGGLKLARGEQYGDYVRSDIARAARLGVDVRMIELEEAREIAPFISAQEGYVISYTPEELYFEPEELLASYVQAAERAGVETRPHCTLIQLEASEGGTRAITSCGDVIVSAVVDAAGAWGPLISREIGFELPVVPTRHQLIVTKPIEAINPGHPAVTIVDNSVYMRPSRGGLLVGGFEPTPRQYRIGDIGSDFGIDNVELDDTPLKRIRDAVSDIVPSLGRTEVAELRGGLPTMTPDHDFVVDRVSEKLNMYVVTGCCISGLSTSLGIGEALAARIHGNEPPVHGNEPPINLDSFRLSRFPSLHDAFEGLFEKTAWQYANYIENESKLTS